MQMKLSLERQPILIRKRRLAVIAMRRVQPQILRQNVQKLVRE